MTFSILPYFNKVRNRFGQFWKRDFEKKGLFTIYPPKPQKVDPWKVEQTSAEANRSIVISRSVSILVSRRFSANWARNFTNIEKWWFYVVERVPGFTSVFESARIAYLVALTKLTQTLYYLSVFQILAETLRSLNYCNWKSLTCHCWSPVLIFIVELFISSNLCLYSAIISKCIIFIFFNFTGIV